MTMFDGWEARLVAGEETLEHSGILGMKHGRNRYQNPDGTWTPLGLERRREREGFGERRAKRKADRQAAKTAKKKAAAKEKAAAVRKKAREAKAKAAEKEKRKAERAKRLEAFREKQRQKNVKNLSDQEIKDRIARLELELKYKEMSKSPAIKIAEKAVVGYLNYRRRNAEREEKEKEQRIRMTEAKAKLVQGQANKKLATSNIIDNLTRGAKYKAAKASIKQHKNNERDRTIRGAISRTAHNIIVAKGEKRVKDIQNSDSSTSGYVRSVVHNMVSNGGGLPGWREWRQNRRGRRDSGSATADYFG